MFFFTGLIFFLSVHGLGRKQLRREELVSSTIRDRSELDCSCRTYGAHSSVKCYAPGQGLGKPLLCDNASCACHWSSLSYYFKWSNLMKWIICPVPSVGFKKQECIMGGYCDYCSLLHITVSAFNCSFTFGFFLYPFKSIKCKMHWVGDTAICVIDAPSMLLSGTDLMTTLHELLPKVKEYLDNSVWKAYL